MSLYVDIHVLQTVPPSNLNRDDTGSPKSAVYGGVRRARVSSQAWKKATRQEFRERLSPEDVATRTKRVVELMVRHIRSQDSELTHEAATKEAAAVLKLLGLNVVPPRTKKAAADEAAAPEDLYDTTQYLLFFSNRQIERLADLALRGNAKKVDAVKAADTEHGIEVSLFGRMVADSKDLSVDAAVQVAHALSTHGVQEESDYYTAVDDETPEDESGAGMLGTIEFNSSTLYRYATIDVVGLHRNLYGDEESDGAATVRAVQEFVRAFALAMPTGKQNTFANRTVPDAVVVMLREDRPVSLVGAFENAVTTSDAEGRVRASAGRLAEQASAVEQFVDAPTLTLVSHAGDRAEAVAALGETMPFAQLVDRLEDPVREAVGRKS